MMMYAWSPNWKTNAVGKDQYNLYARRSFDGGVTWTTTPAALGGNGTTTCEIFRNSTGGLLSTPACTDLRGRRLREGAESLGVDQPQDHGARPALRSHG